MINCITIQGVAQRTATGRFIINEHCPDNCFGIRAAKTYH